MNPSDSSVPIPPVPPDSSPQESRREFLKGAACLLVGGGAMLGPLAAGTAVFIAPLQTRGGGGTFVKLSNLDSLPQGGAPQLVQVVVEKTDAWTRYPLSAVGAVFLQRTAEREVRAFNVSCPHLGCAVEWQGEKTRYYCPCHNSAFAADGVVAGKSPAARGLDTLDVEIRGDGEVWVKFQNFKAGIKDKVAVA